MVAQIIGYPTRKKGKLKKIQSHSMHIFGSHDLYVQIVSLYVCYFGLPFVNDMIKQ